MRKILIFFRVYCLVSTGMILCYDWISRAPREFLVFLGIVLITEGVFVLRKINDLDADDDDDDEGILEPSGAQRGSILVPSEQPALGGLPGVGELQHS
jgi:hypothetical protein